MMASSVHYVISCPGVCVVCCYVYSQAEIEIRVRDDHMKADFEQKLQKITADLLKEKEEALMQVAMEKERERNKALEEERRKMVRETACTLFPCDNMHVYYI